MQNESFGARLRVQREQHDVALAAVADQTKIKLALLEGLERDDLSHWPAGIFRRAYVRAYAKASGLDPDTVVREFLEIYPDPVEVMPAEPADGGSRLRYLVGSALGALPIRRHRNGAAHETPHETPVPTPEASEASADTHPGLSRVVLEMPDVTRVANLCTRLAQALNLDDIVEALGEAARILDAVGMILWVWEPRDAALSAVLGYGYADTMLAQLPRVASDADNAIALAFRARETRLVSGTEATTGAVVVPLVTPHACVGVLALELRRGGEQHEWVRAVATILAAQLAGLLVWPAVAEAVSA